MMRARLSGQHRYGESGRKAVNGAGLDAEFAEVSVPTLPDVITSHSPQMRHALFEPLDVPGSRATALSRERKVRFWQDTVTRQTVELFISHGDVRRKVGASTRGEIDLMCCASEPVKNRSPRVSSEDL